jgi:hypothetical protein
VIVLLISVALFWLVGVIERAAVPWASARRAPERPA